MKTVFLTGIFALTILAQLSAQGFEWSEHIGGPKTDVGTCLVTNDDGSLITVGRFADSIDIDPGPGVFMLRDTGTQGLFIQKTDAQGLLVWAGYMGGSANTRPQAITKDLFGNIFISGIATGQADLDPGPGVFASATTAAFLVKLSPQCTFIWAATVKYTFGVSFNCLATDPGGNIYIGGSFAGFYDFDPGPGVAYLSSDHSVNQSPNDCFVLKLDAGSNFQWAKKWGGSFQEFIYGIDVDKEGMVYTCGTYMSLMDFDPGPGVAQLSTLNSDDSDGFVHKMTSDGNFVWVKQLGGSGVFCTPNDVKVDQNGNIIVGGTFAGNCDFDPGPGVKQIQADISDIFVLKLDKSGEPLWVRTLPGSEEQQLRALTIDELGDIYATGIFKATMDFDPGPEELILTTPLNQSAVYLFKMDFLGNMVWARQLTGTSYGDGIYVDPNGTVYATGSFINQVNMNPLGNPVIYDAVGEQDAYVIKLNQDWNFYGTVFQDLNGNGVRDNGEPGLQGIPIIADGGYASASTLTGTFHFYENISGDTIRITAPWPGWQYTPAFILANQATVLNFAAQGPPTVDIAVTAVETSNFRPGFNTRVELSITNLGTVAANVPVKLAIQSPTVPQPLQFFDSSLSPVSQLPNLIEWMMPGLDPGQTKKISVYFKTYPTVPIGTELSLSVVTIAPGDIYSPNNGSTIKTRVVAAIDPNDKRVNPTVIPLPALDTTGLHYVIRFQNTGTHPATFVIVRDTLPSTLDLSTLQVTASSHPNTWRIFGSNVLEFRFDPIHLPDSTLNEAGSHGYVAFTVQAKPNLVQGTLIQNRAAIFFDYNDPVITNTAVTQVGISVLTQEPPHPQWLDFGIHPNPAAAYTKVAIDLPEISAPNVSVQISDAAGRLLQQYQDLPGKKRLYLNGLPVGNYVVKIQAGEQTGVKRLIVD